VVRVPWEVVKGWRRGRVRLRRWSFMGRDD
jgi:hypothetical protein